MSPEDKLTKASGRDAMGAGIVSQRAALTMLAGVFVTEILVMLALSVLPGMSILVEAIADALMLTVLISPVIYLTMNRLTKSTCHVSVSTGITPRHVILTVLATVSVTEFVAMLILSVLPDMSFFIEASVDALMLTILICPVLYLALVWPLKVRIARAEGLAEKLQHSHDTQKVLNHDLNERIKELNCLYSFANLVDRPHVTLLEILHGLVELIPPAWHYPEITCARVVLDN
ncbi:MAG: hypothetical protein HQ515_18780, partial [Phycisphaeraceae bacterium]|nr:hypothetical protein [Phycisphaeraceae bacterium]